jgi:enoyl-CoA hydratase/carnithine racemase
LTQSLGAIRILTLNRPEKLNALNLEMQRHLLAEMQDIAAADDVRALILTGAGRAFCAGGDHSVRQEVTSGAPTRREEIGRGYLETMRCLLRLSIPVIAAVNGIAAGFGAGLVALCDMVVMGEGALLSDPHVKFDLPADPAAQLMWPRLTSPIIARELLLTGRQVDATEALNLGLANKVCPRGEERAVALQLAKVFVELPPAGVAATKRSLSHGLIEEFEALFAVVSGALETSLIDGPNPRRSGINVP